MAVSVDIHWFDNKGNVVGIYPTEIKEIYSDYSRKRLKKNIVNCRFDDLYVNEEIRSWLIACIQTDILHTKYTAVVIDDILLKPIFIKPKGENYGQDSYELL